MIRHAPLNRIAEQLAYDVMATIDQVQPQKLYRYRSLDKFDRELEALEEGYIFCAAQRCTSFEATNS